MNQTLAEALAEVSRVPELALLAKVTVVLAIGMAGARLARHARASIRHAILATTLATTIALPIAATFAPPFDFELRVATVERPMPSTPATRSSTPAFDPASGNAAPTAPSGVMPAWSTIATWFWAAGALAFLTPMIVSLWRLSRLTRTALPWLAANARVRELAIEADIHRPIDVLLHDEVAAPVTWGFWRAAVLLPPDAPAWNHADLERALVHELEHVRRGDWAVQLGAHVARAFYWFHPLAWTASRQLALEAERACDDAVLARSEDTAYADQLVQLAARLASAAPGALGMAVRSDLSTRVRALLDTAQARGRAGVARSAAVVTAAAALVLVLAPARAIVVAGPIGAAEATTGATGGDVVQPEERVARARTRALDRALVEAAEDASAEEIQGLIDAGANINAPVLGDGSPLIVAARAGRLPIVRMLLERGADPNQGVNGDGNPLIMAAREGHTDVITLLLDSGASIDQVVDGDENALIQASAAGELSAVKLLVSRGADVNARVWVSRTYNSPTGEWRTPLNQARRGNHRDVVSFLIAAGARE